MSKKILAIGGIILVLGIAAGGAYWYTNNSNLGKMDDHHHDDLESVDSGRAEDLEKLASTGKTAEALKGYDDLIQATSDAHMKSIYLTKKATLLLNENKPKDALPVAQVALKTDQNTTTASLLGVIYEQLGNKTAAAKYYKIAGDELDKNDPTYKSRLDYYQHKAEEMSGK